MIRFRPPDFDCPHCGAPAVGNKDLIPGVALFSEPVSFGDLVQVEYFGETEVDWDNQCPIVDAEGLVSLVCQNGHSWQARREDPELNSPQAIPHDQLVSTLNIAVGIAQWAKDHGAERSLIESFLAMASTLLSRGD